MMSLTCRTRSGLTYGERGWVRDDFTATWSRLYHFVLGKVRDPHLSEDIAQETMTRLVAADGGKDLDGQRALGFTIALNLVRDHFRRRKPTDQLHDGLASAEPLADEVVAQRQRLAAVAAVIARMPPMRREIFLRRRVHGDGVGAIADSLGLSRAAVEKHLVRGLADLHRAMPPGGRR
jgi:RNA polymerase sigma-70 factor (ECF subfamily)